jgi:hypothetical protein
VRSATSTSGGGYEIDSWATLSQESIQKHVNHGLDPFLKTRKVESDFPKLNAQLFFDRDYFSPGEPGKFCQFARQNPGEFRPDKRNGANFAWLWQILPGLAPEFPESRLSRADFQNRG